MGDGGSRTKDYDWRAPEEMEAEMMRKELEVWKKKVEKLRERYEELRKVKEKEGGVVLDGMEMLDKLEGKERVE